MTEKKSRLNIRLIEISERDRFGFTHRLWLGNFYQDFTADDVDELKKAVASLSPPRRKK